jgi:hypothetical protein
MSPRHYRQSDRRKRKHEHPAALRESIFLEAKSCVILCTNKGIAGMNKISLYLFLYVFSLISSASLAADIYPRHDKVVLVFIPGIYGSVLKDSQGNTLWGENGIGKRGLSLIEIPNAVPGLYSDVNFNVSIYGTTVKGYSGFDARAKFLVGEPLVFPYDWRKSNKTSAAALDAFLCQKMRPLKKPNRVVFVAHSMGGLVLRHWIKDFLDKGNAACDTIKQEDIGQFVFVGTPQLGAMETVVALVSGKTALEKNPIYASLFTGGMAAYAATFESSYELLPAANIAGPDCTGINQRYAKKLNINIGTGNNPPLYLNDIAKWATLNLPAELPPGMARADFLKVAKERISTSSKTVCELNSYSLPIPIAQKMNFVIGELAESDGTGDIADSTWDTLELDQRAGKTPKHSGEHSKGDGTVPYWSAEPDSLNSKTRLNLPHATAFEHAELLDDAHVVSHLQRIVDRAATDLAWLTTEPLGKPISTKEAWAETRQALVDYDLGAASPEIISAAIGTLAANAKALDISGVDVYRDAREYNGASENSYKAVGFTVAAAIGDDLNNKSTLWANHNSFYYWLQAGNIDMSVKTAFRTSKIAYEFSEQYPNIQPSDISSVESKWKGLLLSKNFKEFAPGFSEEISGYDIYDPEILNIAKNSGYINFDYNAPDAQFKPNT